MRPDYRAQIALLDELSRSRALTMAESIMLERLIYKSRTGARQRATYGSNKELARAGIKTPENWP
jgi:branched-subunit amino acid ABC-type transport system permease component